MHGTSTFTLEKLAVKIEWFFENYKVRGTFWLILRPILKYQALYIRIGKLFV